MPMKIEKKEVTFAHEVDGMHGSGKPLERTVSAQPNASITEAIDLTGNPNRLRVEYNVGKKPETKTLQGLK